MSAVPAQAAAEVRELRALAERAADGLRAWWGTDEFAEGFPAPPAVAEYLAFVAPVVVLALLARVAEAERERDATRKAAKEITRRQMGNQDAAATEAGVWQARANVAEATELDLRTRAQRAEAEAERLRGEIAVALEAAEAVATACGLATARAVVLVLSGALAGGDAA